MEKETTAILTYRDYVPAGVIAVEFCDMEFFGEGREKFKLELEEYLNGRELDSFLAREFLRDRDFNVRNSTKETTTITKEIFSLLV
uniref:Uncharacterized protein n=2 Tax=viral metagenome TaxID=1070528 RepID=A0A6M3LTG0_9ZZZZ